MLTINESDQRDSNRSHNSGPNFGPNMQIYELHFGRSVRPVLRIVPDPTGLYRVEWPDIGLSDYANLARCKQAALEWAQHQRMSEGRDLSVAQRLKSLDNFWWSASYVRQTEAA